ncbi:MAG: diphosphomevalonate decarboxylase [Myxococcales bacterium]
MKATAVAHPNIALVKYWGKRDERLILPHQSSLSMTLDGLSATTTVEFSPDRAEDTAQIDTRRLDGEELARITGVLDLVRQKAGLTHKARVASKTDFPRAAGLASSAAGGAALAAAASWAAGLAPTSAELSILARRNSGSACRSVQGGFCEWARGTAEDGSDSFALQVAPETHWPELRMVVVICADQAKEVSSREAMQRTVETSPYYRSWVEAAEADLKEARAAVLAKDLAALGAVAERNAWRMHASAMAANPSIVYLRPTTLAVLETVAALRAGGVPAYFTLDAGPNPVILCLAAGAQRAAMRLGAVPGVLRTIVAGPGKGVEKVERPVFQ